MSWSNAEGEHKDSVCCSPSLESTRVAPSCVANQKPSLPLNLLDKLIGLSQKKRSVFQSAFRVVPWER